MTESSKENDKSRKLSFKEQILQDLAKAKTKDRRRSAPFSEKLSPDDNGKRKESVTEEVVGPSTVKGYAEKGIVRSRRRDIRTKRNRQNHVAKRIIWVTVVLIFTLLTLSGFAVYNYVSSALQPVEEGNTEYVSIGIPEGSRAGEIGVILEKAGLIKNSTVFSCYAKLKNYSAFQSGYYNLQKSMNLDTIAKKLLEGGTPNPKEVVLGKVTIPEGYTLVQIAEAVTHDATGRKKLSKTPFTADEFMGTVQNEAFISEKVAKYPGLLSSISSTDSGVKYRLEGYLFPATYEYGQRTSVESLIDQMLAAMDERLRPYYSKIAENGMDVNETLTIASLVEKEGLTDEDRGNIASVFYNRLNQNMLLQSNISVLYALDKLGEHTTLEEDSSIDTAVDSPFNSYVYTGLIPGPVVSPSLSAIEAVVNAPKTNYFYFVSDVTTGKVYFSETYAEHLRNVDIYVNSGLTYSQ